MSLPPRIPVVMYHSVGRRLPGWLWENLTISVEMFERQIRLLAAHGYTATDLDDYLEVQARGKAPRGRRVVLSFDDGYLDNWVWAYPLLKRAGWRGTIYVNPEFIDPSEEPRANLDDVWAGRCAERDLPLHGFLNRAEIRAMSDSGVMQIASHSMSHTWFPISPRIEDFHRPDRVTPWLAWNRCPERKHAYLTEDQGPLEAWGYPIHEAGRSLGVRRHLPAPELFAAATDVVAAEGPETFFARRDWETRLREATAPHVAAGRPETDTEMTARYDYEVGESRRVLEEITGGAVRHFCWPGGAYNDDSWARAEAAGYESFSVASHDRKRWTSDDPRLVRRIGCGSNFAFRGGRYYTEDPAFLLMSCEACLGRPQSPWRLRWRKLRGAARTGFRPFKKSS